MTQPTQDNLNPEPAEDRTDMITETEGTEEQVPVETIALPETEEPDAPPELEASETIDEAGEAEVVSADLERLLTTPAGMRSAIEALLFASPEALTLARICNALGTRDKRTVSVLLEQLRDANDAERRGVALIETADGWRMATREVFEELILRLRHRKKRAPLTTAALETLAIVAYRQPIIRAEVEAIRGVECGGTLRNLVDMGLVEVVGRKEVLGRPGMYGTTAQFLESFGLRSIEELPPIAQLKRQMKELEEEKRQAEEEQKAAEAAKEAKEAEEAKATEEDNEINEEAPEDEGEVNAPSDETPEEDAEDENLDDEDSETVNEDDEFGEEEYDGEDDEDSLAEDEDKDEDEDGDDGGENDDENDDRA